MDLLVVVVLILANGLLSFAEMAIISSRKSRLAQLAEEQVTGAKTAVSLSDSPAQFLSAIQVGITGVSTLAGAFGGVAIADDVAKGLKTIHILANHADALAVGLIVCLITFVSLVFGELVPKQVALTDPERWSCFIAPYLNTFSRMVAPAVHVLVASSNAILRVMNITPSNAPPVTETEIKLIIDQARQADVVADEEQDMVEAVLELGDRRVKSIMTPRRELEWLDVTASQEEILQTLLEIPYSRVLICRKDTDNFLGWLDTREALCKLVKGEHVDLTANLIKPLKVPEAKTVLELLEMFKVNREQFATVISEYGGLEGIVTIHDVLQTIVGTVTQPGQHARWEVVQRDDGSYLLDGLMPVDDVLDLLELKNLPGNAEDYDTLAGLMLYQCGHIPSTGEHFDWQGCRFEVVDLDGQRVDKILVVPRKAPEPTDQTETP